ncbi:MAG: ComEA family DNA-binding protein [Chloroflexota bacterium]|nr:ComEA family DNA-binding protein [Chloroflexota bacterium]
MTRSNKFWAAIILFLIIVIVTGSILIWSKYNPNRPIEITISPSPEIIGQISVSGAVNVPGIYPLTSGDSIDALLQSAGGATAFADLDRIKLYITSIDEAEVPQKVDLNRAEAWLLQALPGIGETRAQAIVNYRQQNGQFNHISEITSVEGIGTATCEKIKHLITISD